MNTEDMRQHFEADGSPARIDGGPAVVVPSSDGFGGMVRTLEIVSRRKWLCQRVPACINCGEKDQIQLEGWRWTPANWRCRKCKNGFDHEPASDSLPNDPSSPATVGEPKGMQ